MGSISRLKSNLLLVRPYTCSILDQNHKENDLLLMKLPLINTIAKEHTNKFHGIIAGD